MSIYNPTYKEAYEDGLTETDPEALYVCSHCDRFYKGRAINVHLVKKHGYRWYDQFNVIEPEGVTHHDHAK